MPNLTPRVRLMHTPLMRRTAGLTPAPTLTPARPGIKRLLHTATDAEALACRRHRHRNPSPSPQLRRRRKRQPLGDGPLPLPNPPKRRPPAPPQRPQPPQLPQPDSQKPLPEAPAKSERSLVEVSLLRSKLAALSKNLADAEDRPLPLKPPPGDGPLPLPPLGDGPLPLPPLGDGPLPLPKRRPFTIAKTPRLPVGAGDEGFSIAAMLEKFMFVFHMLQLCSLLGFLGVALAHLDA
jgi:hypothetical protein